MAWTHFYIQWTPSNPATLGTSQSVLIGTVDSFQEWTLHTYILWDILQCFRCPD